MARIPRIALADPDALAPSAFEPYAVRARGGLDLVTPPFERYRNPGAPIHMVNYVSTEEGYELVSGYRPFRTQPVPGVGPLYAIAQHEGQTSGVYAFRRKTTGKLGVYRAATDVHGDWIEMLPESGTLADGIDPPPVGSPVRWKSHAFAANAAQRLYFVTGAGPKGLYSIRADTQGVEYIESADIGTESDTARPDEERFPRFVEAHQGHLMVGYDGGSIIWSSQGLPLIYSAIIGAGEASFPNIGGKLNGLLAGFQNRLWIFGADGIHYLDGASVHEFRTRPLSGSMGATADSMQLGDRPMYFSNEGVREVGVGGPGGFVTDTLSRLMVPFVQNLTKASRRSTASLLLREQAQYRVYFDDGSAIVACRVHRAGQEQGWEFTSLRYPKSVSAASNIPAPTDLREIYLADRALIAFGRETDQADPAQRSSVVGDEPDGIVYLDGSPPQGGAAPDSFDGEPIHGTMHFGLNKMRSPTVLKKFNRTVVEAAGREPFEMGLAFAAADEPDKLQLSSAVSDTFTVPARTAGWADRYEQPVSRWDGMVWDEDQWGGEAEGDEDDKRAAVVRTPGRGLGFAMTLYTKYDESAPAPPPHVVTGFNVFSKPLRHKR